MNASGGGGSSSPPLMSINWTNARYATPKMIEIAPVMMAVVCACFTDGSGTAFTLGGDGGGESVCMVRRRIKWNLSMILMLKIHYWRCTLTFFCAATGAGWLLVGGSADLRRSPQRHAGHPVNKNGWTHHVNKTVNCQRVVYENVPMRVIEA